MEDNKYGDSDELRDSELDNVAGGATDDDNPPPDYDEKDPAGSDIDPSDEIPPGDDTLSPEQ